MPLTDRVECHNLIPFLLFAQQANAVRTRDGRVTSPTCHGGHKDRKKLQRRNIQKIFSTKWVIFFGSNEGPRTNQDHMISLCPLLVWPIDDRHTFQAVTNWWGSVGRVTETSCGDCRVMRVKLTCLSSTECKSRQRWPTSVWIQVRCSYGQIHRVENPLGLVETSWDDEGSSYRRVCVSLPGCIHCFVNVKMYSESRPSSYESSFLESKKKNPQT